MDRASLGHSIGPFDRALSGPAGNVA